MRKVANSLCQKADNFNETKLKVMLRDLKNDTNLFPELQKAGIVNPMLETAYRLAGSIKRMGFSAESDEVRNQQVKAFDDFERAGAVNIVHRQTENDVE